MHILAHQGNLTTASIGVQLAREFIHAQWLGIHLGMAPNASLFDINLWCPVPRMSFRLPLWWNNADVLVYEDSTLVEIYASFATQLTQIARRSDDVALNAIIKSSLAHIDVFLKDQAAQTTQTLPDGEGHSCVPSAPTTQVKSGL
jgi:hypothetical protein